MGFRPPSGGREEPKSEARRAEMLAFGRGFFVRCARPKGCAPLEPPAGGAPAPHALEAPPATLPGPLAEGQGCRGRAPRHPAGRLGSLRSRQGPCPRPYGAAGRTNPLTRPSLKTRQRPAQGLGGALSEWMGVKARAATAQRLGLDAQERPQRSGLVAGGALPPAACHVANAPGGPPEALLPLIFASEVWGFRGGGSPEPGHKGTDQAKRREGPLCILALDLSTTNEVCVSAPLLRFGDWNGGTL